MADPEDAKTVELQDASLVAQVRNGSPDAFEPLVRRYLPMIQGFMLNRLGSDGAWEDLVQETFEAAYRELAGLRQSERFGPWLIRIAKSKLADHRRSRQFRPSDDVDLRASRDARAAIGAELSRSDVLVAIAQLPRRYSAIVYAHLIAEDEPREIAIAFGLNESTVRTRLQRGLERLREALRRRGITKDELRS